MQAGAPEPGSILDSTESAIPQSSPDAAAPSGLSTAFLIAANLLPLAGVLWFNRDLGTVMILFWTESGIIGIFTLLKMAVIDKWPVLLTGPFSVGHFGGFMAVHFLFLYLIFIKGLDAGTNATLGEVAGMFRQLWPALLALFLSHGLSFLMNFIGRREYRGKTPKDQMPEPYRRIMVMHVTLIVGGILSMAPENPASALALLLTLKIIADIHAHRRQRTQ